MQKSPVEIVLTRAELVCLMNMIGATHLAGMELKEFDLPNSRLKKIIKIGKKSLSGRSLIDRKTHEINPVLVDLIKAISFRERAIVLIRGIHGMGRQLFTFNFY